MFISMPFAKLLEFYNILAYKIKLPSTVSELNYHLSIRVLVNVSHSTETTSTPTLKEASNRS